jgi:ATP-binding cassette subfamily B (MDR/TAP) protein 1
MFRFATSFDYALMTIGTICACALGTAMPGFAILLGDMTDAFSKTSDDMVEAGTQIMYKFIYVAIAELFAGWGALACWMITSERQGISCRKEYLKSLLKQEIGWFDTINQSELATNFAADCFAFQGAIG